MRRLAAVGLLLVAIACGKESTPLVTQARGVVDDVTHARWDDARKNFAPLLAQSLSSQQLAAGWATFVKVKGAYRSTGDAGVVERPNFTVVNIVLHMAKGDGQARVTFDKKGQIAGLFFLQPGVPVP